MSSMQKTLRETEDPHKEMPCLGTGRATLYELAGPFSQVI